MAAPWVLTVAACRLNSGAQMASIAASTTGKYSGRQPAITAFIAAFSTVMTRFLTGSSPSTSDPNRPTWSRNRSTASAVGGTTGSPSLDSMLK